MKYLLFISILLFILFGLLASNDDTSPSKGTDQDVIVQLPPEPDKQLNNSTLLGIDYNKNGIRDDVERYIVKRFTQTAEYPKTKTAIALQYAWASQKILENPTIESHIHSNNAISCKFYWLKKTTKDLPTFDAIQFGIKHEIYDSEFKDKVYNTKNRILQKYKYNNALSGKIFLGKTHSLDNCQINIDKLGE